MSHIFESPLPCLYPLLPSKIRNITIPQITKITSFMVHKNSFMPPLCIFEYKYLIYLLYFLAEFEQSFQLLMMTVKDSWCAPAQDPENWDQVHKKQNLGRSGNLPKVQVTGKISIPAYYITTHIRLKMPVT